jgi:protein-L-isoaspartate(D-aspartate) O-methyltransferase
MAQDFVTQRQRLVEHLVHAGVRDAGVLAVIANTPRERFVDEMLLEHAYADLALPTCLGQTISQPLMVALMTQALRLSGRERVLEIGTGSGYQTAILARLAASVYSVERHLPLAFWAAWRLTSMHIQNVSIFVGDGSLGRAEDAPYDRILVAAAAPEVPPCLVAQLTLWGLLVIPVGSQKCQELQVIQRVPWGTRIRSLGDCVFVPLVGAAGWKP